MTSKRFLRRFNAGRFTSEKARAMNRARWDAEERRLAAQAPAIAREIAQAEVENLPHRKGDPLGCLQWTDFRTGKARRWVVRIGHRRDQITVETPGGEPSRSHGWAWVMVKLRKAIVGRGTAPPG